MKKVLVFWTGMSGDMYIEGKHIAENMNGEQTAEMIRKYKLTDHGMIRIKYGEPFREYSGWTEG